MSFKDMVETDNANVFLSINEFADSRTLIYDGVTYTDRSVILTGIKETDRSQSVNDHAQGLYLVTQILHMKRSDLGGVQPEKGGKIKINNREGGGGFFREYYIASSDCQMGMLRIELEAIDE